MCLLFATVFIFIFSVQNWATIVTGDGVVIHRPCTVTVYYQREEIYNFFMNTKIAYNTSGVFLINKVSRKFL